MRIVTTLSLVTLAGCTTLGPMPGMTMGHPIPTSGERPSAELQYAIVPGFYLSQSVEDTAPEWTAQHQGAAWFDPGRLLGPASGLGVGLRWVGGGGSMWEPMLRYRTHLGTDERVALSVVGFGTYAEAESEGASYSMTRGGAEVTVDVRLTPKSRWIELHGSGGLSVTGLHASGTWCADPATGWARTCHFANGETGDTSREVTTALPAAFVGLSLDILRDVPVFHGLRLGGWFAGGTMPEVRSDPKEEGHRPWFSAGFSVTAGLGDW